MNVNSLIFGINKQQTKESFKKVIDHIEEFDLTTSDIDAFCKELNINSDHLFVSPAPHIPFYYYNFPVFFEIYSLDINEDTSEFRKAYKKQAEERAKLFEQEKWSVYLYVTQGPCSSIIFQEIFKRIAPKERYGQLREFYVSQYHGHSQITKEMWEDAITNRPNDYVPSLPGDEVEFVVYRGGGSLSAPLDQTLSWTTDLMTAAKFAYRSSEEPVIYKGLVKSEHIVDYFDERDEYEVIAEPEHIEQQTVFMQRESIQFYTELLNENLIEEFNLYKNTFIKKQNFLKQSDLHGEKHTTRVLIHAMALAHIEQLNERDRGILANAAIYHDIGRTHDGIDPHHGEVSAERVDERGLPLTLIDCQHPEYGEPYRLDVFDDEEETIIKLIMTYHAKDDSIGLSDEATWPLSPLAKKRYERLYSLFKDADGLDRVRLSDINDAYFRNEATPTLVVFALRILDTLK